MLLERNAFDSIEFFSQCTGLVVTYWTLAQNLSNFWGLIHFVK